MLFELGVLAAFGAMVCWGFGDFFIQKSTRQSGDVESLAFIGIIGSVMLLPFVLLDLHLLFSVENLLFLSFIGIVTLFVALLDFEALKEGKLSVIEIVFEVELPITVILGLVFFAETLSTQQAALVLLILAGIGLLSLGAISKQHYFKRFEKGVMLAVIGAIGMAFLNFLTAAGSRQVSPAMAVWVPYLVFTIICLFLIWRREGFPKLVKNAKTYKLVILGMGVFDTLAWLLFAFAVLEEELAVTIAIIECYPAVGLVLGVLINREKVRKHQVAGAAIALAACISLGLLL
ncbi:MAG: EamA family transporter [Candidatus Diapherotrites archaeon]|uniref:EamA family transporter n=1 Tax=Candidatus Iainarchaeum sp. TaxID=3101447 RepID=A0A939C9T1_9ARCH|nr:EamA family transporter [Candidatus Diapherotrites archaeon]